MNEKAVLAALLIAVLLGSGCTSVQDTAQYEETTTGETGAVTSEETVITVWAWNIVADSLNTMIPEFNKEYPDIKVVVEQYPVNEVQDKMIHAITTGGEMPDVIAAEGTIAKQYIVMGGLLDITEKALPYYDDFVEYKWPEVSDNDRIYGLPWDAGPVGVFYRRDVFEREEIDPATIETWDDFIEVGKQITKDTDGDGEVDQYMITLSSKNDAVDLFEMLVQQQGGSFVNSNGEATLNNDISINALNLMKRMKDDGITVNLGYFTPEFYDELKRDNVAVYVQAVWFGGLIKSIAPDTTGLWGVFPMPAFEEGGARSSTNGGSNFAVTSQTEHPEESWKLIEFLTTKASSQLKMYKEHNTFPALKSTYTDELFEESEEFYGDQATRSMFVETQEKLPPNWIYSAEHTDIGHILDTEISTFLSGEKTAEEMLEDVEERVNVILAS